MSKQKKQMKTDRFRKSGKVQGGAVEVKAPHDVSGGSFNPLHLDFVPGTEGAGRIAATRKSGIPEKEIGWVSSRYDMTIPTVARVEWTPTMGPLFNPIGQSVVSAALYKLYNYIRSKNASISAYSPFDLLFALEAVSGLAILFGTIRKRLQILCASGSQITVAYPEGLFVAHGLTTTDRDSLASYIARFNQLVELSKGLIIPKFYKLFARRASLASTLYLDDPIISKSQIISMEPRAFYMWDLDPTSTTVGQLRSVAISAGNPIYYTLGLLESTIRMYLMDVDMNNIFAEIRKAFGESEVYHFLPFNVEGEALQITFDQVLLDQLHNAVMVGEIDPVNNPGVLENTVRGTLEYQSGTIDIQAGWNFVADNNEIPFEYGTGTSSNEGVYTGPTLYVYAHDDQPDEKSTADLVYWKVTTSTYGANRKKLNWVGSEVINNVLTYSYEWPQGASSGPHNVYERQFYFYNKFSANSGADTYHASTAFRDYHSFGYLPVIHTEFNVDGKAGMEVIFEGDIDNRYPAASAAVENLVTTSFAWLITCD